MARGWESKSVESQIEAGRSDQVASGREPLTPEKAEALRKRESLLLARTRLLEQIQASSHPRHRAMLEAALAELDKLLAKIH